MFLALDILDFVFMLRFENMMFEYGFYWCFVKIVLWVLLFLLV